MELFCVCNSSLQCLINDVLYSLCMKLQAELVNFQDQLENRVLCKTFPSRQNSEVQPSVTKHEEFKLHLNDIITTFCTNFM